MPQTFRLHWLAGIIEGEGSFTSPYPGSMRISVEMTDEDIIDKLLKVSGVGKKYGPYQKKQGVKQCWQWVVAASTDSASLAMTLFPLMGERRKGQITKSLVSWRSVFNKSDIVHGTDGGYHKEIRRGYPTCDSCRAKHNERNMK